jgi:N-acetylmuramoyl-L-alanine amidase
MADIAAGGRAGSATGIARRCCLLLGTRGAAVLLIGLAAGCQQPQVCLTSLPDPSLQPQITVYELANRLNLDVRQVNAKYAWLSNRGNTVLLVLGPNGRAYLNGRPVAGPGGIYLYTDTVWVPAGLAEILQGYLSASARSPLRADAALPRAANNRPGGPVFHIVIDAGHGGKDPGAVSVYGMYEKTINLAVARSLGARLRAQGVRVTLTREADAFVELDERAAIANRTGADLFVSIHADSCRNRRTNGCTVYMCRGAANAAGRAAAAIVRAMSRAGLPTKGVRLADYRVLTATQCPAVLVELGYLSNPVEARLLAQAGVQEQLAESMAAGLVAFVQASAGR